MHSGAPAADAGADSRMEMSVLAASETRTLVHGLETAFDWVGTSHRSRRRYAAAVLAPPPDSVVDSPKSMVLEAAEKTDSDSALVEAARLGDRRAFRQIVERHQGTLARTIVGLIGDRGSVDDVLQDVFIQFYNSLGNYRGDASVRTYLNRIAVNKSLDTLRARKRWRQRFLSRDETPIVEVAASVETAEDNDRNKILWRAIDSLPDAQRSVVVLRMVEGYSTEETAELLSVEYGTVLSRLSRGLEKLRKVLGPVFDDATKPTKTAHQ